MAEEDFADLLEEYHDAIDSFILLNKGLGSLNRGKLNSKSNF